MATNNTHARKDLTFEIKQVLGALGPRKETGYQRLVTVCSFNGGENRIDIREWSESMDRMSKGLRISEDEAEKLCKILTERYSAR